MSAPRPAADARSSRTSDAAPDPLDALFAELGAMWPGRWASLFKTDLAVETWRVVWGTSLREANLNVGEVRGGLSRLAQAGGDWPPSLPEFLAACRPPLDYAAAYASAARLFADRAVGRVTPDADPVLFWAGVALGSGDLAEPYREHAERWRHALDAAWTDPELPPIPPLKRALPAPLPDPAVAVPVLEAARACVAQARTPQADPQADPRAWARRVLERAASGEVLPAIALAYAAEALGRKPQTRKTAPDGP